MLNIIAIVGIVVVASVLVSAAVKPSTFRVQRTTTIKAAPEKIVPLIEDFRSWRCWSPYEKVDSAMRRHLSGAAKGKGSIYAWAGNAKSAAGRMEIIDTSSSQVTIQLDFIKPFEGHNITEFKFEPKGDATNVTWAMHGPSPYLATIARTFFNMDRMLGDDFETGLANLKAIAER